MLDNCEHLIAGAAELADRAARRLPEAEDRGHEPRGAGDLRRGAGRGPAARPDTRAGRCSPTARAAALPGFVVDDARARRSAAAWTGSRSRSSWPRRGCARSRAASWPSAWTTASGCSPAAAAPRSRATARCARSSTGAGTCSTSPSAGSRGGWRSSARARRSSRASAVDETDALDGLAALVERSLAAGRPGRRADALPDARDPARVRAREARGGGGAGGRCARGTRATSRELVAEAEPRAAAGRPAALVRAAGRRAREHHRRRCATSARPATRARRSGSR